MELHNQATAGSDIVAVIVRSVLIAGDGRRLTRQIAFAKGAPENPLRDEELGAKVRSLVVPVLGEARCRELTDCVARLEQVADLRDLTRLLVPGSGA